MKRIGRVPEHGKMRKRRDHFPKQRQPLALQIGGYGRQPGQISAGARKACDKARAYGIAHGDHDAGDRIGCILHGEGSGCTGCNDHIDARGDQFRHQRREPLVVSFRPTIFNDDVPAFDITEVA